MPQRCTRNINTYSIQLYVSHIEDSSETSDSLNKCEIGLFQNCIIIIIIIWHVPCQCVAPLATNSLHRPQRLIQGQLYSILEGKIVQIGRSSEWPSRRCRGPLHLLDGHSEERPICTVGQLGAPTRGAQLAYSSRSDGHQSECSWRQLSRPFWPGGQTTTVSGEVLLLDNSGWSLELIKSVLKGKDAQTVVETIFSQLYRKILYKLLSPELLFWAHFIMHAPQTVWLSPRPPSWSKGVSPGQTDGEGEGKSDGEGKRTRDRVGSHGAPGPWPCAR